MWSEWEWQEEWRDQALKIILFDAKLTVKCEHYVISIDYDNGIKRT